MGEGILSCVGNTVNEMAAAVVSEAYPDLEIGREQESSFREVTTSKLVFDRASHSPLSNSSQRTMPDESSVSPSWEYYLDSNGLSPTGSNHLYPNLSHTPPTNDSTFPTNPLSSPQPRTSSESVGRTSSSKWRESAGHSTLERRGTVTTITTNPDTSTLVEPSFDENLLRMLCDLDVSGLSCKRMGCLGLRNLWLITVLRPAVTGQNQTEHSVV